MTQTLHPLMAISALDGRYRGKAEALAPLVSEFGLMRYRVLVECRWFAHLAAAPGIGELPALSAAQQQGLEAIVAGFDLTAAERIKGLEASTNHDVKAVEYFVKERVRQIDGLASHVEFVHFACTSEDINNLAYALMLRDARADVLLPAMSFLVARVSALADAHADLPMLSRTHGQPASPTTLGKELRNVAARLARQRLAVAEADLLGKINGAVGNFNAHVSAYPDVDWPALTDGFVSALGLTPNHHTTQIEPHDFIAELFHALMRFNQVVLDFDRDLWSYIAIDYFRQRKVEGETGSSTMPHKVNPIDFENSEGNLGIANALLGHMAEKLPVSRWQRDLSDSTVLRNVGSALGHSLLALQSTLRGLDRLEVNEAVIAADLAERWEVLGEAVQTVMRRYGLAEPYEQLKQATRGRQLDEALYRRLLGELALPPAARAELERLTPAGYVGLAGELARRDH
ncbi:MAG: adenylosuccinate lyase [Pseudomonadales bacterium]